MERGSPVLGGELRRHLRELGGVGMRAVKRMGRGMVDRYGDRPGRGADEPAFTIRASAGGMEPGGFVWQEEGDEMSDIRFHGAGITSEQTAGQIPRKSAEPAHTITGKGTSVWSSRPATTTAAGSNVIAGPGRSEFEKGGVSRQNRPGSVKVTVEEAAALQSFDADLTWDAVKPNGRKVTQGEKYQIVGNAVPVLLVERVLEALWAPAAEAELAAAA
ncbi:DNA cytosine methyltransferase [Agromyces larvae]|uniref:DNA cytosine methyltransferase n=1 Tax=Agromyces larvae TaxID=2929802 RepID=A0ABY4C651_9MICO|nr:DNA cytosine methyltransferase [Agromyces larvae]UOE45902.1 DNA cytosine methyltransferase [Agromyces larvae]